MNIGKLRHKVTIHNLIETQSTITGEMVQSWSTGASVWAAIEPLQGRELWQIQQFQAKVDTRITVRYSNDSTAITAKSMLTHSTGDQDYFVESIINPDERNVELQMMCFRVQA
jgi:SPP1 family predicted phage head-tail adaptor